MQNDHQSRGVKRPRGGTDNDDDGIPLFLPTIDALREIESQGNSEEIELLTRRAAYAARSSQQYQPNKGTGTTEEWELTKTDEGKIFYYHRPTKRRQWDKPEGEHIKIIESKSKKKKKKSEIDLNAPMFDNDTGHAIASGAGSHVSFAGVEFVSKPTKFVKSDDLRATLPGQAEPIEPPKGRTLEELREALTKGDQSDVEEEDSGKFNPWGGDEPDIESLLDEIGGDEKQDNQPVNNAIAIKVEDESVVDPMEQNMMDLIKKLNLNPNSSFRASQPRLLYERKYKAIPKDKREVLFSKCINLIGLDKNEQRKTNEAKILNKIQQVKNLLLTTDRKFCLTGPSKEAIEAKYTDLLSHDTQDEKLYEDHFEAELKPILIKFIKFKKDLDNQRIHEFKMLLVELIRDYSILSDEREFFKTYEIRSYHYKDRYPESLFVSDVSGSINPPNLVEKTPVPLSDIPKPSAKLHSPRWVDIERLIQNDPRYKYLPRICNPMKVFDTVLHREFILPRNAVRKAEGYEVSEVKAPMADFTDAERRAFTSVLSQILPTNALSVTFEDLGDLLRSSPAYTANKAVSSIEEDKQHAIFNDFQYQFSKKQLTYCRNIMKSHQQELSELLTKHHGRLTVDQVLSVLIPASNNGLYVKFIDNYDSKIAKLYREWRTQLLEEWSQLCLEFLKSSSDLNPTVSESLKPEEWHNMVKALRTDPLFNKLYIVDDKRALDLVKDAQDTILKAKSSAKTSRLDREEFENEKGDGSRLSDFDRVTANDYDPSALIEDDE